MTHRPRALLLLAILLLGAAPPPAIRIAPREIEFPATVSRQAFGREVFGMGMPGYHLIVWKEGKAAPAALFRAAVTDVEVLDALEGLGARGGNALGMATWDERGDRSSEAPKQVIAGPPVEILVRVPGRSALVTLPEIVADSGGRGFDMRFGGHRANIPKWRSGCIVCLYSCPGSKVGNARYTVHDWQADPSRFRVRRDAPLPADGGQVGIVLRLR